MDPVLLLLPLGALAAGFVAGLTGFGTSLVALSFWLYAVAPTLAAPLAVFSGVATHIQTFPKIMRIVPWRRALPFVICGLVGVPAGVMALKLLEPAVFRFWIGLFLVTYATFSLVGGTRIRLRSERHMAGAAVGLAGGFLGGLAGLSGAIPSIWATVNGWNKEDTRGTVQVFNMAILTMTFAGYGLNGLLTWDLAKLAAITFPMSMLGGWLGHRTFWAIDEKSFRKVVLVLLLAAGAMLLVLN